MKKLLSFFTCIFLVAAFTLNAQDYAKKGVWELGGSISYSNNSLVINGESGEMDGFEIPSISTFMVNIPVYYFVVDGWQIGLVPEFVSLSSGTDDFDFSTSAYGIFFSTSYNFKTGGSVYPFIEGRVGYSAANLSLDADIDLGEFELLKGNAVQQDNMLDETLSGLGWGFSGGIKIQVGKAALINLGVGYQQRTYDPEETITVAGEEIEVGEFDRNGINTILVSAGVSIFLGR